MLHDKGIVFSLILLEWVRDKAARDYAGERAFGYIDAHRGAAERTADLLADLMTS